MKLNGSLGFILIIFSALTSACGSSTPSLPAEFPTLTSKTQPPEPTAKVATPTGGGDLEVDAHQISAFLVEDLQLGILAAPQVICNVEKPFTWSTLYEGFDSNAGLRDKDGLPYSDQYHVNLQFLPANNETGNWEYDSSWIDHSCSTMADAGCAAWLDEPQYETAQGQYSIKNEGTHSQPDFWMYMSLDGYDASNTNIFDQERFFDDIELSLTPIATNGCRQP